MAKKFQVVTRSVPMVSQPNDYEALSTELLYGEVVETISHSGDFLKCRNLKDGYEGYVNKSALNEDIITPTHKICKLHSNIYSEPDYKTQPITHLSFLSGVSLSGEEEDGFSELEGGGWIWHDDLAQIEDISLTPLQAATMFLGMPYLWGGKTSRGIDCSGLIQLALHNTGQECPRDSKDQAKAKIGNALPIEEDFNSIQFQAGDIVFFKGHVGIMTDKKNILNATARTMDVRIEKLSDIMPYYDNGITAIRRI